MSILVKRVYDSPDPTDGVRVLVDRLWPRGISKEAAALDSWAKDATPSTELRKSWHGDPRGHEPERYAAFADAYREELSREPALGAVRDLAELARAAERPGAAPLTLVTGVKDPERSHVPVLVEAITAALGGVAAS
ncbi:DUF488 domain-containing protein [Leucobacter albus]|uniref:DUF488 domain-containing protein n=1 Tax=Leucobacter albus TaxID=272210 RepID=A0ABW3TSM6_9MICO